MAIKKDIFSNKFCFHWHVHSLRSYDILSVSDDDRNFRNVIIHPRTSLILKNNLKNFLHDLSLPLLILPNKNLISLFPKILHITLNNDILIYLTLSILDELRHLELIFSRFNSINILFYLHRKINM